MTAKAPVQETGAQTFEVVRFGWTAPDRLELEGRWYGVRGVRFVRPTLVLVAGEGHRRALALLEHKPWPAEDGRTWLAAFPWEGDAMEADAGELSVAPGIVVPLPPPDLLGGARPKPRPAAQAPARPRATAGDQGLVQRAAATERAQEELAAQRGAREALEREHAELRRRADAAERDRDRAVKEREAALGARDEAVRERDSVLVVRDRLEREREQLAAERDALRDELREVVKARDAVMDSRGTTAEALHRAETDRDAAIAERDELRAASDGGDDAVARAEAERDAAMKERDRLRRRLNEVARPPDTAAAASEQLVRLTARLDAVTAERDRLAAERERLKAAKQAPATAETPLPGPRPIPIIDDAAPPAVKPVLPNVPAADPEPRWSHRAAALIALGVVVLVLLLLVLKSLL